MHWVYTTKVRPFVRFSAPCLSRGGKGTSPPTIIRASWSTTESRKGKRLNKRFHFYRMPTPVFRAHVSRGRKVRFLWMDNGRTVVRTCVKNRGAKCNIRKFGTDVHFLCKIWATILCKSSMKIVH